MSLQAPIRLRSVILPPAAGTTPSRPQTALLPEQWTLPTVLHWLLRIAMLWCFVGHGAFGIMGKEGWLPYYRIFGIPDSLAWDTMPIIGAMDITIAVVTLFRPMRAVLVYAVVWTFFTALLRPLAGQGLWQEVAERGGNFGIPLALLILVGLGDRSARSWFESARPRELTAEVRQWLAWSLRICIALLLIGHGGFGVTHLHDKEWTSYLGVLGFSGDLAGSGQMLAIGVFEIALGIAVLVKPWRQLIVFVLVWKLFTELLRPLSGEPIFELMERGGDFFLPLALLALQSMAHRDDEVRVTPVRLPTPATVAPALQARWTAVSTVPVAATTFLANGSVDTPAPAVLDDDIVRAAGALAARVASQRDRGRQAAPTS